MLPKDIIYELYFVMYYLRVHHSQVGKNPSVDCSNYYVQRLTQFLLYCSLFYFYTIPWLTCLFTMIVKYIIVLYPLNSNTASSGLSLRRIVYYKAKNCIRIKFSLNNLVHSKWSSKQEINLFHLIRIALMNLALIVVNV